MTALLVGIFVGGRGSRLGGVDKGLLKAPNGDVTLIERLLGELRAALPAAKVVLVGDARAYAALALPVVADEPAGIGPLGGVIGLLELAQRSSAQQVLVLSCDLPRIEREVLARLASSAPHASVLVTEQGGVRNPLIARYDVEAALPAARLVLEKNLRSVQAVLDAMKGEVVTLPLSEAERATLVDWDVPEDVQRDR